MSFLLRQLGSPVQDIEIAAVAVDPVAFLGGQFEYYSKVLKIFQRPIDCCRGKPSFFDERS